MAILADGLRIDLPARPLGAWRWAGLFPLLLGLAFSGSAVIWMLRAGGMLPGGLRVLPVPRMIYAAFGLPFFLAGSMAMGFGLGMLLGRARIEISGGRLRAIERLGLLRYRRSRPLADLRQLVVGLPSEPSTRTLSLPGLPEDLAALTAEFTKARPMVLALGYPRSMLNQVAAELADRAQAQRLAPMPITEHRLGAALAPPIPVIDATGVDALPDEAVAQPPGSKAVVDERPDGLTITLPPVGFTRGNRGMGCFAVVWLGFCTLVSSFLVQSLFRGQQDAWAGLAFISLFWAVGLALLVAAVNMGSRRAIIDVIGPPSRAPTLLISQQSIFGRRQQDWPRAELAGVGVGPSGMEINDRPVLQLQVAPRQGKPAGFFSGRDAAELEWLAARLRVALDLSRPGAPDASRPFADPAGTLNTGPHPPA